MVNLPQTVVSKVSIRWNWKNKKWNRCNFGISTLFRIYNSFETICKNTEILLCCNLFWEKNIMFSFSIFSFFVSTVTLFGTFFRENKIILHLLEVAKHLSIKRTVFQSYRIYIKPRGNLGTWKTIYFWNHWKKPKFCMEKFSPKTYSPKLYWFLCY